MSTLRVANIQFESTANNRIQYDGSNSFSLVAGGFSGIDNVTTTDRIDYSNDTRTAVASANLSQARSYFSGV